MLAIRINALDRFRRATSLHLPPDWLEPAQQVSVRASERLALSRLHTVVAIAGPTGSGKSTMFNALAGMTISPVGVRRPTTSGVYACVWGSPTDAAPVLDWVGVPPSKRFTRESPLDADDQAGLRGLVLLDLPDFDSIERDHAAEVERLLARVDLVIWVVDPQKYADQSLHEQQLPAMRTHQDVMVMALNQTDLLAADETEQVLADLRKLLVDGGLADVPALATSAVTGPAGLMELRSRLGRAVTAKRAALRRLSADLDEVVAGLADLVGPEVPAEIAPDRELIDGLAAAAGLPAITEAVAWSYRRRASAATAWPVPRTQPGPPVLAPPQQATQRAALSLAARAFAARAADQLPPPWPAAVTDAARSRLESLPAALAGAVAVTVAGHQTRTPWWWRLIGGAQWLAAGAAAVGLCWLLVGWVLRVVALPVTQPRIGLILLVGGLGLGLLLAAVSQPLIWWAARAAQSRVAADLRSVLAEVAREYLVSPAQEVRRAYTEARSALRTAAGERG
ncbi:50S ribosome-binding GTPase [Natronosporangium hydrolyticum]|uniref:50S ribosome-binding GTPase n=2 Tax=Natronosporangium hydrolyticum TaxID=2811111 RepID=A0A895YNJ0_9ACTN|nr:50S ribosome-binding GTPase [Natronosporangium hydrolyticum]